MAAAPKHSLLFTLLSSLCFTLLITSTSSRQLPDKSTTPLNVSSSLNQALTILSYDPQTTTQPQLTQDSTPCFSNTTSSFSLQLHSRETIRKSQPKDYKSLVLSRLSRDQSRVNYLISKVNGILKFEARAQSISIPVTSGSSQGSGEYFSRFGIGSPAKLFSMVLDTGSDITWLQCEPCCECYEQTDPVFDPKTSSTYKSLSCDSQQCSALEMPGCKINQCQYQVVYGDGSCTSGDFATETLSFGKFGNVDNIAIGCGHNNQGLFTGAAGLLGLGRGSLSFPSQIKATSFSYCLVNRDSTGSSTLDFNSGLTAGSVTAPLLRSPRIRTFYYVGITGMSVGGKLLPIPESTFQLDTGGNGGIIVDCGTTITRLQTEAYNSLRDSFLNQTQNLRRVESDVDLFDTCYDLSGESTVQVPTVSFQFSGGKEWSLPASNYMIPIDSKGTFCLAFAPTSSSLSIIGNVQQQGTRISFDLAKDVVGFADAKC